MADPELDLSGVVAGTSEFTLDYVLARLDPPECRYAHHEGECVGGLNRVTWPDTEVWHLCDGHHDRNAHRMQSAHVEALADDGGLR